MAVTDYEYGVSAKDIYLRPSLFLAFLVVILAVMVDCNALGAPITKRFTFSVSLVVDGRPVAGSTVWEMYSEETSGSFGNALPYNHYARGEAIAIPLSDGSVIFVLKRARNFVSSRSYGAFLAQCGPTSPEEIAVFQGGCDVRDVPEIVLASGEVHGTSIPDLTLVRDGRAGGVLVEIDELSAEVTNEPRSSGLLDTYPWIASLPTGVTSTISGRNTHAFRPGTLYLIDFISQ